MCKKYVGLLLFVLASMIFVGCSEDPYDWSGDSERTVPIPVDLIVEFNDMWFWASCTVEQHENDLPILEAGFFYGLNKNVTYETGERIKANVIDGKFDCEHGGINQDYFYIGAYITTSRGTVTIGPKYVSY